MKILKKKSGFTIIETLVALLVTGIMVSSAFEFYITMHNQTMTQDEISELQQNARACIVDITKNLRMAGFKVGAHSAYAINGDSLYIFYQDTQPVDTVLYFLSAHPDYELNAGYAEGETEGAQRPFRLMKKVNSDRPAVFSDYILDINFNQISTSVIEVTVTTQTTRADEDYVDNYGFRQFQASEQVYLRNVNL